MRFGYYAEYVVEYAFQLEVSANPVIHVQTRFELEYSILKRLVSI